MKQQQPLVSFILTCYNLPVAMLCECINSILALSLRPFEREIIVVDDGSDVSPMNGLLQYGNDIIYVRQRNAGVSVARNTAMRMARGTYLQIVDGDDCLLQAPYEHCLDLIRYGKEPDVVLFNFTHSKNGGSVPVATPNAVSGSDYMRNHNIQGAAWCYLFRQSCRGKLEFTPGVAYGEDEEFTPQLLLRADTVYATEAKAYYYRQHQASAVHQSYDDKFQKRLTDSKEVILHLNRLVDTLNHNDRLAMQRRVAQLTMDYIYNTIRLTRSRRELDSRLEELQAEGLFPLPDRDYSQKYKWFRRMTSTQWGRQLLLHTLPYLKKEK